MAGNLASVDQSRDGALVAARLAHIGQRVENTRPFGWASGDGHSLSVRRATIAGPIPLSMPAAPEARSR